MKQPINEIKRMQQLAGLIIENEDSFLAQTRGDAIVPYRFDGKNDIEGYKRGLELYKKYQKAFNNPAWKEIDGQYEMEIKLNDLLSITGMTLDELKELNDYGDETWNFYIDEKKGTVTEFND